MKLPQSFCGRHVSPFQFQVPTMPHTPALADEPGGSSGCCGCSCGITAYHIFARPEGVDSDGREARANLMKHDAEPL